VRFALLLVLVGLPARAAWPQVSLGTQAGVLLTPRERPSVSGGLSLEVAATRHWVLMGTADVALGQNSRPRLVGVATGLGYRMDVALVVPYAAGLVRHSLSRAGSAPWEGLLALGVTLPLGTLWFVGLEARYGVSLTGALPTHTTYGLRLGARTGPF
jgi:hypothetical protein